MAALTTTLVSPLFFGIIVSTTDTLREKLCVGFLWLLDSLHLSTSLFVAYRVLVSAWNNFLHISSDNQLFSVLKLQTLIMILMISYIHTLYGFMAWKLRCNFHWGALYAVLFVIMVGHAFIAASQLYHLQKSLVVDFTRDFGPALYVTFSAATVVSTVLVVFIWYTLRLSQDEFAASSSRFSLFLHYFLASGFLTSVLQITILAMYAALPQSFAFFAAEMILPGVYGNSYLALLNARTMFRHGLRCAISPNQLLFRSGPAVHISTVTNINCDVRRLKPGHSTHDLENGLGDASSKG
ncbi:hypothetical protein ONZ45_g6919 [Pleurotus djamor]|nr:hypothetical protein ONZ45_g6919 [Pleurotus djamor]